MLINRHKRYIKKYRVSGSGIFDTLTKLTTSNTARRLASAAASNLGKTAISAGKTAAKELATAAISAAKDVAIEKGKQFVSRLTQKNKDILDGLATNSGGDAIRIKDLVGGRGLRFV